MWICERCETYNQDDQFQCRICKADKPVLNQTVDDGLLETQISYDQPSQTVSEPPPVLKPILKPSTKIAAPLPVDTAKPKEKSGISTSEKILIAIELEERQKEIARKRRIRRIALGVVNGVLLIANLITVLWIVR